MHTYIYNSKKYRTVYNMHTHTNFATDFTTDLTYITRNSVGRVDEKSGSFVSELLEVCGR